MKKLSWNRLHHLYKLRKNLNEQPSVLQNRKLKLLQAIVKYAYENVPFYHAKFKAARVMPDDLKSLDDLAKFPVTSKEEIQGCSADQILARGFNPGNCMKRTTSGSTGNPLTVYIDSNAAAIEDAIWARTYFEGGLRLRDRMAVVGEPRNFPKNSFSTRRTPLRRRYVSIFDDAISQISMLNKYRPDVVKGYPSSLLMLAEACGGGACCFKPRLIFSSAELLDSQTRSKIKSMCSVDLLDNYACAELSLLAWECKEHAGYHMNIDNTHIEFIGETDEFVLPNQRGEIVCTSLHNHAMPLIRYRTEDIGIPLESSCSCGRTLPLMKMLEGRADDFLQTTLGKKIPPIIFFPYPFDNTEGIKQFKVIQQSKMDMTIQVVATNETKNKSQVFIEAENTIKRLFGEDMTVEFQFLESIPKESNGKLRKVVSLIN
jgi:phenylacetate-CoA ligase